MLQKTRVLATRDNKYYYLRSGVFTGNTIVWITDQATSTEPAPLEQQAQLGGNVQFVTAGGPTDPTLDFTPIKTSPPMFNAHGVPCALSGGVCVNTVGSNPIGYQLYLTDSRSMGSNGWATVIVAPGGRIQTYIYNGSSWGN